VTDSWGYLLLLVVVVVVVMVVVVMINVNKSLVHLFPSLMQHKLLF
jgi:hypothetical protein